MAESSKMKEMPVDRLMNEGGKRSGIKCPDAGIPGSDAYGCSGGWNRCGNQCASGKDTWTGKQ